MAILSVDEFLSNIQSENYFLVDTRSESEFNHAHIQRAFNLPLLNDEHRKLVGTCFKKKGREAAVRLGFEIVGPLFASFVKTIDSVAANKKILVYCWRGGMRSGIMSWVLSMSGYQVDTMKGGYKAFRNSVLNEFIIPRKLAVIGGHTGCGKTDLLKLMKSQGLSIVDLEGLANHRGSAFGHLGMKAQTTNEQFENDLALELKRIPLEAIVYAEAESRSIGRIKIPDEFYFQLSAAPVFELSLNAADRIKRIAIDYGHFSKEELSASIDKILKRLGGLRHKQCIEALEADRTEEWIGILLDYYDSQYTHSLDSRTSIQRLVIEMKDQNDHQRNIEKINTHAQLIFQK